MRLKEPHTLGFGVSTWRGPAYSHFPFSVKLECRFGARQL